VTAGHSLTAGGLLPYLVIVKSGLQEFLGSKFFSTKTKHESTTQKHMKNTPYSPGSEGWETPCENGMKNENEIHEFHKS